MLRPWTQRRPVACLSAIGHLARTREVGQGRGPSALAIYRLSAQIVKRSDGRSATAAAAYRAGAAIADERTGLVFDYTRRRGVIHAEILAPPEASAALQDRVILWNAVEAIERRRDAQLAREIELALPHEITAEQRLELVRGFVQREFVARGMIADIAMHRPDRRGDRRNHHAHVMLTLRPIAGDAFGDKARAWNDKAALEHWREAWAEAVNLALSLNGHVSQIDHRSYVDRDIHLEPEPKMGPVATAMERRGRRSHAGDDRRAVRARNAQRQDAEAMLARISAELSALEENGGAATIESPPLPPASQSLPVVAPPPRRSAPQRNAAAWRSYLFKLWATVARAVTSPFQTIATSITRRKKPDLRR